MMQASLFAGLISGFTILESLFYRTLKEIFDVA